MAITPKFTRRDMDVLFKDRLRRIDQAIVLSLCTLGEKCVNHARDLTPATGGFGDVTGNLRSSIGYVVYRNGSPVKIDFKLKSGPQGSGSVGYSAGQSLASEVAAKYPKGYVLVVVAGMNYAVYVESKGRDVLTSAEKIAETELPKMLRQLKDNIRTMK